MTLHIYTKVERVFMTKAFISHTYNTRVFMKNHFSCTNTGRFDTMVFLPSTKIFMKLLTNKTTDRHRYVPPVMGGVCYTLVLEQLG